MWILGGPLDGTARRAHLRGMERIALARPPTLGLRLAAYSATLLMLAAATVIGFEIAPRWGSAPVVLLYLPPVIAAAVWFGLWPSLVAAVGSTLAYNYFFTVPYRTFFIAHPGDVVTVIVLLLVALVTSHLAGSVREQARLARAHAARNATIAGFARRLLSCPDETAITEVTVRELAGLFDANALLLSRGDDPQVFAASTPNPELSPGDHAAASLVFDTGEPAGRGLRRGTLADWQFHPVVSDRAVTAAAGLARTDGAPPIGEHHTELLGSLLDQAALALERARLDREAREVIALRERDALRSALLTSIGEDVKPRLNAIAGAARALKREGSDKALASTVAAEAAMLDRYVDNLVDVAPGADREPLAIGPLAIDLYRRAVLRDGVEVHLTPKAYAVLAELAKHAGRVLTHAHLLRSVWGPAQEQHIDYLRVAVRALRQKLERDPANPELILNEPAVGYRLAAS